MQHLIPVFEVMKNNELEKEFADVKLYKNSFQSYEDTLFLMVKDRNAKWLLVSGNHESFQELQGEIVREGEKVCPLTHENRLVLNRYFEYTVPQAFGNKIPTIGLGDRIGLASPGHIEVVRNTKMKPILAQQSIRELTLTSRSMSDIVDAASFAVFQEGYTGGFGADGDHLKEEADIQHALSIGMSMITLDCSDYIPTNIANVASETLKENYQALPQDVRDYYNREYLNKTFDVNGISITFDEISLIKCVLIYQEAIQYMIHVNDKYILKEERDIDFEISIDETETITSPTEHFFVANELMHNQVKVVSLAPRFCGEFQKGIDYIGDIERFEKELEEHALIAKHFDYKLSIHSGSDKFKVFPIISKYTNGLFHVKTAGTNWLEAIRVTARVNPQLYRRMHVFALENFKTAQAYYHVTPELENIAPLDSIDDDNLDCYMDNDAARQLFHITYGLLLMEKNNDGTFTFRDELYKALNNHEVDYRNALSSHIGKHLKLLGF